MAFIDSYLPLPTKPLVNSSFNFRTDVLTNSDFKEQRIPKLNEYKLTVDLSDVTFTESEMVTFINFYRTSLQGKLNTFRFKHPFENSVTHDPVTLKNDFLVNDFYGGLVPPSPYEGETRTYGRAVVIGTQTIDVTTYNVYQVFKVYEIIGADNTVWRAYKTIRTIDQSTNALTILTLAGGDAGSIFTVDEENGRFLRIQSNNDILSVACDYDHEMRLDVDGIPKIALAFQSDAQVAAQGNSDCDKYRFESLPLVEVLNYKVNPYSAIGFGSPIIETTVDSLINGSGLVPESYPQLVNDGVPFDLPLRPIETLEFQFDTKVITINEFENRQAYTDTDRFRGVFDSTRVYQDDAQRLLAHFLVVKGRLSRFNVQFRQPGTILGRFEDDTMTFNQLVAASESGYHNFSTNTTQKSLYDLQSLGFYEAVGVDPVDLTGFNEIACTTGTATNTLVFENIDGATNFVTGFEDIKFISLGQSALTTLATPLFTVIQKTNDEIRIVEGGWGTDPLVEDSGAITLVNGRLGIDSTNLVASTDSQGQIAIATDGDVAIYTKGNLTTPVQTEDVEALWELADGSSGNSDARICGMFTGADGLIYISMEDTVDGKIAVVDYNGATNSFNENGDRDIDGAGDKFVFASLNVNAQDTFFSPSREEIVYTQQGNEIIIAATPTGAGLNAIAHEVRDAGLASNYISVIAGGLAPEDGMVLVSLLPINPLVNTTGVDTPVMTPANLAGFTHNRRVMNIGNTIFFPTDGVVGQVYSSAIGQLVNYENLIDEDSPLQASDMTSKEFYSATVARNGSGYVFRAGNATPTSPYALGVDFLLTKITSRVRLVKEVQQLYSIPPLSIEFTPVFIDPQNPDMAIADASDPTGGYSGSIGGGTGGTEGVSSQFNMSSYSIGNINVPLPPDATGTAFRVRGVMSDTTGTQFVLLVFSSSVSNNYRGRLIVYRLQNNGVSYSWAYDAVNTAIVRDYIIPTGVGITMGDQLWRTGDNTANLFYRANDTLPFNSGYTTGFNGLLRISLDTSGTLNFNFYNDSVLPVGVLTSDVWNYPVLVNDSTVYIDAGGTSDDQLIANLNGLEYRSASPGTNGYPYTNTTVTSQFNLFQENLGASERQIRFGDSTTFSTVFSWWGNSGNLTFPLFTGNDGGQLKLALASTACESNDSPCSSGTTTNLVQIYRQNTASMTTTPTLIDVTRWNTTPFAPNGGDMYYFQLTGNPFRVCDQFGNAIASGSGAIAYYQASSGLVYDLSTQLGVGASAATGFLAVTQFGFFMCLDGDNLNVTDPTFVFIQPRAI